MRRVRHAILPIVLAMACVLVGTVGPVPAQVGRGSDYVSLYGVVQWISANRMVVLTDCPQIPSCTSLSIPIDLKRVPLSEYRGVRIGSWVQVVGIVSHDPGRHDLVATSVTLVEDRQAP
jgi:hypothetical protein